MYNNYWQHGQILYLLHFVIYGLSDSLQRFLNPFSSTPIFFVAMTLYHKG
uniref:Uncharacterized protein n=1 Tax=Arundo donax TaxID=35708 RepID=A0A0A9DD95_ARUDO